MTVQKNIKEQLLQFFNDAVADDTNLFLVDFYKNPKKNEFIFLVDGISPIDLGKLSGISRSISREIDEHIEEETPFTFQISTPGADKPLKDIRQFKKHIGRTLVIKTKTNQKLEGELLEVNQENSSFEIGVAGNKKKKIDPHTLTIHLDTETVVIVKIKF